MLLHAVVHDLYRATLRIVVAIVPLILWYPAWALADSLWRSLLIGMQQSGVAAGAGSYRLAYAAWPTAALLGPALVMALMLILRRFALVTSLTAVAAIAGMAAATGPASPDLTQPAPAAAPAIAPGRSLDGVTIAPAPADDFGRLPRQKQP